MKKLGSIIIGFILGALLTYYFCPRSLDTEEEIAIVKPKGVISITNAKELNKNWTDFRQAAVDSAAKKQGRNKDNRWVWWSLDEVENYIAYSKNQTDSLGYEMTGLRFYLGVYGNNKGQNKKNLTTLFAVPTGKKSISEASSFYLNFLANEDIPGGLPFNNGTGGSGGYPQ
ncbi:hypothetical protein [uncultured Algibacter sp.]|uniref:hypothetical protein n=1 Tax=uncultured Algibacter sp. TaxID=298659 RepID=UPI00263547AB|nr:hypothetical protein [uncultured Algibacter sp.]